MTMISLSAKGNLHLSMMNSQRRRRRRTLYKYLVFLKYQKAMPLHQSLNRLIKISLLRPPRMHIKSRCRMSRNQYLKRSKMKSIHLPVSLLTRMQRKPRMSLRLSPCLWYLQTHSQWQCQLKKMFRNPTLWTFKERRNQSIMMMYPGR